MNPEHYNLIARHLSGEAAPEESERLKKWLTESPENQALFERAEQLWQKSRQIEPNTIPDIDAAWLELKARAEREPARQKAKILPFRKSFTTASRPFVRGAIAAAAAIVLIFTIHGLMDDVWLSVATTNGEMKKINLPDGSIVTLNYDSKVEFPQDFSEVGRQIRLSGEAYFEVVKDSTTFSIATENAAVQVLGTKFNVWGRNQETRVAVSEGKVSLQNAQEEVILRAGESSYSLGNQPPAQVRAADAEVYLGWLQGKLVFSETPLHEIADELQLKYDVRIQLSEPGIDTLTVTGAFHKQSLKTVLQSICLTLGLQYTHRDGVYLISKK